nr:HNH endonuclease signature motif containing protein [Geodermatophilus sabuli]
MTAVVDVQAAVNRLSALQTRLVRAADVRQAHRNDGMVSMRSWLTGHCRVSGREAVALVRAGRRLAELPEVEAAFTAGEMTSAHVGVIASAVTPARVAAAAGHGIDVAETDRVLATAARELGPEDTAKAVRRWVAGVDPDGQLADAADVDRRFSLAVSLTGRVYLSGHLDPVGAETVHTALESLAGADRPAGDLRSHAERQGEALVELCRRALVAGELPEVRGERPQVRVTIDWQSLSAARTAAGAAPAELPFAGPVTPETARRLACDASVVRMITGPHGLPMDVGRAQRTASAGVRRAVELRDDGCVFAGCTAPAAWCDVHHVVHWAHGGPTSCENGALLCERHHTAVHEGGFAVRRDPGTAVWHTVRPDGSEIVPRGPCRSG